MAAPLPPIEERTSYIVASTILISCAVGVLLRAALHGINAIDVLIHSLDGYTILVLSTIALSILLLHAMRDRAKQAQEARIAARIRAAYIDTHTRRLPP